MNAQSADAVTLDKEARRQKYRVHMSGMSFVNALIQCEVIGLFAMAGTIPVWVAVAFFAVSMGATGAILLFTKLGYNLKIKDQSLLLGQILINASIQIGFIFLAPKLTILFLLALFVISGYGVLQFSLKKFTVVWLLFGLVTGIVMLLNRDQISYPGISYFETTLVWLFFFLALRQHTLVSTQFSHLRKKITERNQQLQDSLAQIEVMASHDYLTGAFNRRSMIEKLENELKRSERTKEDFCFAMLDLDHFKKINDQHGHPVGDAVLKQLSLSATQSLRTLDSFGRLGGEEFGIVLPNSSLAQGIVGLERLRHAVQVFNWNEIATDLKVTFSAGIVCFKEGDTSEALVKLADDALYRAKRDGRNKILPVERVA